MTESTPPPIESLVFAGTHGHVIALRKEDGTKVWTRSLPGTGYSVVSIVYEDGKLFCASGGHTFALAPEDGRILWENGLPGMSHGLVYLTTSSSNDTERVLTLLAQAAEAQRAANAGGVVDAG